LRELTKGSAEEYPRELNTLERTLLLWVLPEDRLGYAEYRRSVEDWKVVATGRRGDGNYILAADGHIPDLESPLTHLFAFGVVELGSGDLSVSVRERTAEQLEFEIAGPAVEDSVSVFEGTRCWTYSDWSPSRPCPRCGRALREVDMSTTSGRQLVLALCAPDQRLWVYDARSGVNRPIPVTSFYNELMLQSEVQDRTVALNARRLFTDIGAFSDAALTRAFSTYNKLRTTVPLENPLVLTSAKKAGWLQRQPRGSRRT